MKWQPIETAPTDRSLLLYDRWCRAEKNRLFVGRYSEFDSSHYRRPTFISQGHPKRPTHWVELPDAPND